MIGIVIVAHGGLAREYLAAVEHVVGKQRGIRTVAIEEDQVAQAVGAAVAEVLGEHGARAERGRAGVQRTGAEAVDALSAEVTRIVKKAIERTKANGRKTVRGHDFVVGH